jgi:hypothetical protein
LTRAGRDDGKDFSMRADFFEWVCCGGVRLRLRRRLAAMPLLGRGGGAECGGDVLGETMKGMKK